MHHTTKEKTDFFKYKNTPNISACNLAQKSRADQAYSKEYIRFASFIEDHPYMMMTGDEIFRYLDLSRRASTKLIVQLVEEKRLFVASSTPYTFLKSKIDDRLIFTAKETEIKKYEQSVEDFLLSFAKPSSLIEYYAEGGI